MIVWKYAYRLLRCYTKINAQRTISTSPLYFCSRLVSGTTISKRAGEAYLLRYCGQINPRRIRTDRDVRGDKQQRDLCYAQISSLRSVQGSTLLNRLFAKALEGHIYFVTAHKLILNVSERTGMSVVISSSEFFVRKTRSPRMCKDAHSWARMSGVLNRSEALYIDNL